MTSSSLSSSAAIGARGNSSSNSICQPIVYSIWSPARLRDRQRIEENGDRRISRRQFDDTGNICPFETTSYAEHLAQRFISRILELIANRDGRRRTSDRRNSNQRANSR